MTIVLAQTNTGARMAGADWRAATIVADTLSYEVEGKPGHGPGWKPKTQTFLRQPECLFEAGFVPMVKDALQAAGYPVHVHDLRDASMAMGPAIDLARPSSFERGDDGKDYPQYAGYLDGIELRDFQAQAVETVAREGRGIVWAATGAGKTEIGVALTKRIGKPTLWLTHQLDLVDQTAKRYQKRLGRPVGRISEGDWLPSDITVSTVQTLAAHWTRWWKADGFVPRLDPVSGLVCGEDPASKTVRGDTEKDARRALRKLGMHKIARLELVRDNSQTVVDFLNSVELVIIDEAHRSSGETFFKILAACQRAYFRISLTATPLMKGNRHDDLRLIAASGNVICRITNKMLIDRGILARPTFTFTSIPASSASLKKRDDWQTAYVKGIVYNEHRNARVVADTLEASREGRKPVVLVLREEHGQRLLGLICASGLRAVWVNGKSSLAKRLEARRQLRDGEIDCIVASTIFDEGIDEACISAVVLAGGGKAKIQLFQRVGRGSRKKVGGDLERFGNTLRVYDYIDGCHPKLFEHSAGRFKIAKDEEGWEVEAIRV